MFVILKSIYFTDVHSSLVYDSYTIYDSTEVIIKINWDVVEVLYKNKKGKTSTIFTLSLSDLLNRFPSYKVWVLKLFWVVGRPYRVGVYGLRRRREVIDERLFLRHYL